jgi:Tol biopolymer transport system component
VNGEGLEQITYDTDFDSFPMFSPDGKRLSFSSNRNNGDTRSTNVFVADWTN